jgi:glycosyltransferase involved in cell wall biosynthesis
VARLETEWKGHDILLEVLSAEKWKRREWELTIFGNGPDRKYIQDLIAMFGLQSKVKFGGYVRSVEQIYKNHHALLLPSRGEGLPLSALEAMMCGRPVITTDVGGNREIIEEQQSGFVADAPTPASFGRALELAWRLREDWEAIGKNAAKKARELEAENPPRKLLHYLLSLV